MEISISCEAYVRLASLAITLSITPKHGPHLKAIFFECNAENMIAVATNVRLAAIEKLPNPKRATGNFALAVNSAMIEQCKVEMSFGSSLTIVINEALGYASAKTTFGYIFPDNVFVSQPPNSEFNKWRSWLPDGLPTKTKGPMFLDLVRLSQLITAAPSGVIVFPEFIDNSQPVVIQDMNNRDWIGAFFPMIIDSDTGEIFKEEAAKIPGWIK